MADLANEPSHLREQRLSREFEQRMAMEAEAEALHREWAESGEEEEAPAPKPRGVGMTRRALIGAVSGLATVLVRVFRRAGA